MSLDWKMAILKDGKIVILEDAFLTNGGRGIYYLKNYKLHRTDGPAVILPDGTKEWWIHGHQYDPITWLFKVHEMNQEKS